MEERRAFTSLALLPSAARAGEAATTFRKFRSRGPSRSGFLSAFFTLVGTDGIHVASGLIALIYLVAQVIAKGLPAAVLRRLLCWSLFWHALDIVWVGVFTLVYLMGDYH